MLETAQVSGDVLATLKSLAGKGTPLHDRHRLYLDVLGPRFPFLPREPRWWPRDELSRRLTHFSVAVLDPTDCLPGWRTGDSVAMVDAAPWPHRARATNRVPSPLKWFPVRRGDESHRHGRQRSPGRHVRRRACSS